MIAVDMKDVRHYENMLKGFARRSFPFATRHTLNTAGFMARKETQNNINKDFVNRNRYTANSIRVDQTRTLDVSAQKVVVGSVAAYLPNQEFGATVRKKGKTGIPIATSYSSGEGESTVPRRRMPRKPNKLANITLRDRRRVAGSRKRQNAAAIRMASVSSNKYVYLKTQSSEGIFKVVGGKRRPRVKMVYDLSNPTVTINPNPVMKPAVDLTRQAMPDIYFKALRFQLKRQGLA